MLGLKGRWANNLSNHPTGPTRELFNKSFLSSLPPKRVPLCPDLHVIQPLDGIGILRSKNFLFLLKPYLENLCALGSLNGRFYIHLQTKFISWKVSQRRLWNYFEGRQLNLENASRDYGIKKDVSISLIIRLWGGAKGNGASSASKRPSFKDALNSGSSSQPLKALAG